MAIILEPYQWLVRDAIWKPVSKLLFAADVSGVMHITHGYERVRDVWVSYSVQGGSGAVLNIETLTSGQNADAGIDQLTGTIDLNTTADTPIQGTLIDTPTLLTPGDMLGFTLAGTLTGLVNCSVTVYLEQLQRGT